VCAFGDLQRIKRSFVIFKPLSSLSLDTTVTKPIQA
jgi:hypothetical protein